MERGDVVEWFSASYPGAPTEESLEGVQIIRAGRQWTVHWAAYRRYRGRLLGEFDVVLDEVNTIPFFTPLWAPIPIVMLIHQLAREVWWYEATFPVNALGYLFEPLYLRLYRNVPALTVSASTRDDLKRLGFKSSVTIVPEGIEPITVDPKPAKPIEPSFLYVGRIAPSKRIGHILLALSRFRKATGGGSLRLVGSGSERHKRSLTRLAKRLDIANSVIFSGRLSSDEKHRLMAEAHALVMTSVREGWGLVVTEANACGTPAIVYDVPGLRDSVRHGVTGLVVTPRPNSLSNAMIQLMADPDLYRRLATESQQWSQTFSFDDSARAVALALERSVAA